MKKLILASALLLFCALILCGCSQQAEPEPEAVVFVVGANGGFPYQGVLSSLDEMIYNACYSYGEVTFIVVDGEPYIGADYDIKKPDVNIDNTKRKQLARENTDAIMNKLKKLSAKTAETDPISAMIMASDKLKSSDCTVKTVMMADSGIQTTGLLNFATSQLIEESPQNIASALREYNSLPDFTGVSIKAVGIGQTAGIQQPLTRDMKIKLNAIWETIFSESGAASVEFDQTPLAVYDSGIDYPYITPITVIYNTIIHTVTDEETAVNEETPEPSPVMPEVIRLDETSIRFEGNKAEFTDPEAAELALRPIAEFLCANPGLKVYLAGMTASSGGDGIELSLSRAEAVKAVLCGMGCVSDSMSCIGLGRTPNHLRADDLDESGMLVENMAKLNRAVFVFEYGSDTAQRLGLG